MSNALSSYLRTRRKKLGLTQAELAFLLGLKSSQAVFHYERNERSLSLETALMCQVIFDVLPHELHPGLYMQAEKATKRRARALIADLEGKPATAIVVYKRNALARVIERIDAQRQSL